MKKLFGTLCLIIIIAAGLLWVFRANIASRWISNQTGANVMIEQFNPTPWGLVMKNSIIHHPETETTLTIGLLTLQTPFLGLFSEPVTIDKLAMKEVVLTSRPEKIKLNSFDSLLKIANGATDTRPNKKENESHKKFIVHDIEATNVAVEIGNPFGKGSLVKTTIPLLKLKNINEGDAITLEYLIDYISKNFLAKGTKR